MEWKKQHIFAAVKLVNPRIKRFSVSIRIYFKFFSVEIAYILTIVIEKFSTTKWKSWQKKHSVGVSEDEARKKKFYSKMLREQVICMREEKNILLPIKYQKSELFSPRLFFFSFRMFVCLLKFKAVTIHGLFAKILFKLRCS